MLTATTSRLLDAPRVDRDERFWDSCRPLLAVDVAAAVHGDQPALAHYVAAWRQVRQDLLSALRAEQPELVLPALAVEALDAEAAHAPFSAWVAAEGAPRGLALDLLARLRALLGPPARPLAPPRRTGPDRGIPAEPEETRRFLRETRAALDGTGTLASSIQRAFDVNASELGRLFGVSRQAVAQWPRGEIPVDRRGKAAVILAIADLLTHRLKAGRLPAVARRPAAGYGGHSMIELIAADRHEELLAAVRDSFDFAAGI